MALEQKLIYVLILKISYKSFQNRPTIKVKDLCGDEEHANETKCCHLPYLD